VITVTDLRTHQRPHETRGAPSDRRWPTYVGITGLLLLLLVTLAGGIIWYGSKKSNELAVAYTQRRMEEVGEKIIDRIRLLYDPMYAIVGIGSLVPELTTLAVNDDTNAKTLILRALRSYPQILSLYVGFDNGDFFMITHIAGDKAADLRKALHAPGSAVFANEIVSADSGGQRTARWVFFAKDGSVVARLNSAPSTFDPRGRPWYTLAKNSGQVEHSDLYIFAASGEPGFSLSRRFKAAIPGVVGADLASVDLASFLRQQRITAGSTAFIFTRAGEIVAVPDQTRLAKTVYADGEFKLKLPRIADLNDPIISGLADAYRGHQMAGTRVFDVNGRPYVSRVVDIPPRYGRDQLLAIAVPIDEIEAPIAAIRNDTLLYSVAFLGFALPLYVTLVIIWIDRKLDRRPAWPRFRDDE
jgi:adenylate cyclase